jgi:serine protease Do
LVSLKLGELQKQDAIEEDIEEVEDVERTSDVVLGIAVEDLDDEIRDSVGLDKGGILVQRVMGDAAIKAEVERGDIITQFDGQQVEDVQGFKKMVAQITGDRTLAILVIRDGAARFLAFKPDVESEK